jgi:ATP-dependent DNA helicase RecQ
VASGDAGLFEALRAWRAQVAREHQVPAYTVFHDATLRELAERRPGHLDALRGVTGIGERKLERYGEALLAVVAAAAGS